MIVKKMPILQGFPDFQSVKKLSKFYMQTEKFRPFFYDIETTGLSQYSTFLYLIGAIAEEDGQWMLYQWFGDTEKDEKELLDSFAVFVKKYTYSISYNGNRFDQPYLEARYKLYDMPSPFEGIPSLDLYELLAPCRALLKLPRMKQPDLESFLKLPVRLFCDGREGIRCYKNYRKSREKELREELMGHNQEDLTGLGCIMKMLAYRLLYDGGYQPESAQRIDDTLLLTLTLHAPAPVLFSNGDKNFYISGEGTAVKLLVPLIGGRVRQYYPDYKNYDFIPSEDTAIPKSLSAYMDRSLRIPAKKDTCYTWFSCNKAFLTDPARQMQYLRSSLPYLLGTL